MKSLKSICVALCAALVLAGCGMSKTGQGALIGAGGGAGLGVQGQESTGPLTLGAGGVPWGPGLMPPDSVSLSLPVHREAPVRR